MARMHSRDKGKSGSKRVIKEHSWVRHKPQEVELLVTKLAKEDKSTSEIGIVLRDTYGIPNVKQITEKSILQILRENKLEKDIPEDLMNLIRKLVTVKTHFENNRQDKTSLRGLQLTEAKINRLIRYYKQNDVLPIEWKLEADRLKLLI